MRAFFDAMRLETLEAVRAWPIDTPFPALPTMRRITLRVILRTALGLAPGPEMDGYERKIETFLSTGRQRYALVLMTIVPIHRLSGSRWVPFFRQLATSTTTCSRSSRRGGGASGTSSGENVLDDLLAATHEDGSPLDDHEVRDAIFTILIAGHDTTAWPWPGRWSNRAPPEIDRLHDELRRVTGGARPRPINCRRSNTLTRQSVKVCVAVPACIFVVRKTMRPFVAGGREYPAGWSSARARTWSIGARTYPEPDPFRPDRFLERKFGPHEWFPFGGGNRVCLGMPFALYEMKVLLATLFSQVRLDRPTGPRSRARRYGLVLGPDDGARVVVMGQGSQQ